MSIVLVLGGARSGKSAVAERLAGETRTAVTYVATGIVSDDSMRARVAAHRARRPAIWTTAECGAQLVTALADVRGTALVDSLGTWVAAHRDLRVDVDGLVRALLARAPHDTIVVSDEVGLAVHPETDAGRRFVDAMGELNQAVAAVADRVALVVAGRVLWLPGAGA